MTSHLTDEVFAEVLAGEAAPQALAHLDRCEPCRQEADRLSGALAAFKDQSLAWAESRAGARSMPAPAIRGFLLAFPRSMQAAAALLLACAVVGGAFRSVHHAEPATAVHHEHPTGSLAEDNRLLISIDQELGAQEPSPSAVYAMSAVRGGSGTAVSE